MDRKERVRFFPGKDAGVVTSVGGRISFPNGFSPKIDEEWIVEIAGENPRKTVYFLKPVRRWTGSLEDCRLLGWKEQIDFRNGKLVCESRSSYRDRISFSAKGIEEYEDYKYLRQNQDHLIIRNGRGISWAEDGRVPYNFELSWWVSRLATEGSKVPVGEEGAVKTFLSDLQSKRAEVTAARIKEETENALFFEEKIRPHLTGSKLETREVSADSYKVEVLADEDWGLHKADPGYSIRVTPLYKDSVDSYTAVTRPIMDEVAKLLFGSDRTWLDHEEAAEDESYTASGSGPHKLSDKLVADLVAHRWMKLVVRLTEEQKAEIESRHPDRDGREFRTEIVRWIRKA